MSEAEVAVDNMNYVSLHNHTTFSILDSLIKPSDLFNRAKELGQEAVAVTDHGTLAGMWDALKASRSTGVKLIAGCEFYFVDDVKDLDARMRHVILLAKNEIGYRNLLSCAAEGYDNFNVLFKRVFSRIDWNILEKYSEGLICLTSCSNGILSQLINQKKFDEVENQTIRLKKIFGDNLGIELQAHALKRTNNAYSGEIDQLYTNDRLRELAIKHDIKCVVTSDAHYVYPEQSASHDVLLAIASGQPVDSGSRLKYTGTNGILSDFYIKSGEEIFKKLNRQFSRKDKDFAKQCIENTKWFADQCEMPEWIDPKFSNPSGKELPEFPVKDQLDYSEFLAWCDENPMNKNEDEKYLRFRCEKGLKSKIPKEKHAEYSARLEEEYEVMEYHKFSSYMLIVMDYIEWARKNNIGVGPGRGCLTGDAKVLTNNGFVRLDQLQIGNKVFTHTGSLQEIKKTFAYSVNETGLEITTENQFRSIKLTSDHKLFASKQLSSSYKEDFCTVKKLGYSNPTWIKASDLSKGDAIFTSFPIRTDCDDVSFDLVDFISEKDKYTYDDKYIYQIIHKKNELSIKNIAKSLNISFESVRKLKNKIDQNAFITNSVIGFLDKKGLSLQTWQDLDISHLRKINRFITIDEEFAYLLGRWCGDGSLHGKDKGINISFNKNDYDGISKINSIYEKYGFGTSVLPSKKTNGLNITVSFKPLCRLFKSIFPNYSNSHTKHLPMFYRQLDDKYLLSMMMGLFDADGCNKLKKKEIKTTSEFLANDIKEALLYLKIPSVVYNYTTKRYDKYTHDAFHIQFDFEPIDSYGYYSKIKSINSCILNKVYDIKVQQDHSYLTTNYVVHNSVGGSLIGYLIDIHIADPIKYGLIFARFHNKQKTSFPDIDTDFAPSGRALVQDYIRQKYGNDHVAHVSNINTLTPKVYARAIARAFVYGGDRKTAVTVGTAIADAIPNDIKTVESAFEKAPLFAQYAKPVSEDGGGYSELKDYSKDIGGKAVAWSTHAGGVVIGKRSLRGLIPLRRDKEGNLAIEYEKERAEANGLVKMDTLGLETLDIISETYRIIDDCGKPVPPPPDFNQYDKKTYDLISNGDTFCVFQLGTSGGTIDLCKKVKPHCIEDIAVINSLARPSAKDIRSAYVDVRDGKKPVSLLHDSLQRAFGPTLGFGLYEECLLYLAQDVAGWNLHEADRLRKLTKEKGKNPEKAAKWREEFIDDSEKNGIDRKIATKIWDEIIELFSGYGFNHCISSLEHIDVYTPEGTFITSKPIKNVEAGDFVRSRDEKTGKDIYIEVVDNHDHGKLEVVEVELKTGEKVKCTMNHKFRTKETGEMLSLKEILNRGLSIVVSDA